MENVYQVRPEFDAPNYLRWIRHAAKHGCLLYRDPETDGVVHLCVGCPKRYRPLGFSWPLRAAPVVWSGGGK